MAAFTFPRDRGKAVLLEKLYRAAATAEQEIVLADADPEQFQPFLQTGIVELRLLLFEPGFSGGRNLCWSIRHRWPAPSRSWARKDIQQARTEDADVGEFLQIRQRDVER